MTAARSPARRWLRRLGWVGLVLFGAGCASELDRNALDGRPCPCLPGWVCDASQGEAGTCVREGAALAGDLRNTSSDVPDAGAAAVLGDSADSVPPACAVAAEPSGGACPALCDECRDGTCFIHCNDSRQCGGSAGSPATLACPPGFHCDVSCESESSCSFLSVQCPGDHACSTECTGKKSCNSLSLACAGGPCRLACGSAAQSCRNSELQCGSGACQASCQGSEVPAVANCAASCSAQCGC